MPFGNIATFHLPVAGSAGASQWGTDVRKLLDSGNGTADTTTVCNHGTNTAQQNRTCDPYSTSAADLTEADYGWAIAPPDMNSVAGAKRYFPAGNHVLQGRMSTNSLIDVNATFKLAAYRVASAAGSRARTLLSSVTRAITIANAGSNISVALNLPEIIFEPDETIQYSFENQTPGTLVTGKTTTFHTGLSGGQACRIVTPGLKTLADATGSSSGAASASGVGAKVLGTEGASSGAASASGIGAARADTTGSSSAAATVGGSLSAVAGTTGSSSGAATADAVGAAVGSMTGTSNGVASAAGVLGGIGAMTGTSSGAAAVDGALGGIGSMTGSSAGVASAAGQVSSVAGTTGSASGAATVSGQVSKVLGTVGSVNVSQGGGETIVRRPIFVFED